jgi:putative transcriptional regulator
MVKYISMQKSLYIACGMALAFIIGTTVVPAGSDTAGAHDGLLSMKPKRPTLPEPDPFGEKQPGKGKFLVASRNLSDPRFHETVVLLIDYGAGGATGIIVNRPTKVTLAEVLPSMPGLKKRTDIVYYGGPVENNILLMLIQTGEKPVEAVRVFGDVYVSASKNTLELMIGSQKTEKELRTYSGYAGWMAGQLDWEVSRGDWFIVRADAQSIFNSDAYGIWRELIERGSAIQVRHQNGVSIGAEQSRPAASFLWGLLIR